MTHVCIIAGEPSGDVIGAKIMAALKAQAPDVRFSGIGGYQMRAQGLDSLFSYEQLAVMGVAEVVPKIPQLLARIRQTVEHIVERRPDIVVTIDAPDFCFRVIKAVRKRTDNPPKFVHVVAPTVWAWREGRAAKAAKLLDGLICLFDFEPPYFEKYGLRAVGIGHPMVESGALEASGATFRDEAGIARKEKAVGILFGSRQGELKRTGPILADAAVRLAGLCDTPPHLIAPTLPHLHQDVRRLLKHYLGAVHIVIEQNQKWNAFRSMDAAMAVSGTVGLELAMLQVPHVIAYKANALTAMLVRRLIKVRYVHLANIMADREIVPEFLQEKAEAGVIADATFRLLTNPDAQKQGLAGIAERLGAGQDQTPSQKTAEFVLSFLSLSS